MSVLTAEDEELARLDAELDRHHLEGHWRLGSGALRPAPVPVAPAHVWHWQDIRRLLARAGEMRGIEGGASRRTVRLCTPGLPVKWTTPTIHTSVQLVKPGEIAEAHRHSIGAFRFVIEGQGGWTNVEGEKFAMAPGDLILTPQGTWHDHGHDGGEPMMWIDGHDYPLVGHLNGLFFQPYRQMQQEEKYRAGHAAWRSGGLRPRGAASPAGGQPYRYDGAEARALLAELGHELDDPRLGITLDYVNPLTGGSTLPTMQCRLSRIAPQRETLRYRHTANVIHHVVAGRGSTRAGDRTLEWGPGDIFVVPGWTWHQHRADPAQEAILFTVSDEPVFRALALYRCEDAAA